MDAGPGRFQKRRKAAALAELVGPRLREARAHTGRAVPVGRAMQQALVMFDAAHALHVGLQNALRGVTSASPRLRPCPYPPPAALPPGASPPAACAIGVGVRHPRRSKASAASLPPAPPAALDGGAFTVGPASRQASGGRSSSRHAPIDRISLGRNRALYAILRLSETQ